MIQAYQLGGAAALGWRPSCWLAIPGYRVGAVVTWSHRGDPRHRPLLLVDRAVVGDYAIVDEFNIVFVAINTLVGFTTALFSASYIGHEIETGGPPPTSCDSITPCSRR